ncbi:AcrR family transcriptional regulator [Actinokineospora baliensis]|uniref:TetR/AcrR family transcriptional regulator n=1 Tax=Actinokineospora baliensis TaxID=547056 RepID=UPI00195E9F55|nr:TetR/AcrR family transcriptional regulator [Actinokineospora baliensis]MBM7774525.1 AcrR family transcriptional regulator [Actinokineospora baliensis]
MSPRRSDPNTRAALVEITARLLAENGPRALSARRIAAEAGTSTMAVYTHFGGMRGLIREIVHEGFSRLQDHLRQIATTDDPVVDMAALGRAYRHNAVANPHLYAIMFGAASHAGFSLSRQDRQHGRYTLANVVACAGRCIAVGRFREGDAELVAHQMWIATHGLVTLELGGYLVEPHDADRCFEAQLVALMVSAGDGVDTAAASVARSAGRFPIAVPPGDGARP